MLHMRVYVRVVVHLCICVVAYMSLYVRRATQLYLYQLVYVLHMRVYVSVVVHLCICVRDYMSLYVRRVALLYVYRWCMCYI